MDMKEIDERLKRLESRNKENFLDIEKRFAKLEGMLPKTGGEPVIIEGSDKPAGDVNSLLERIQELEDLLLLIELENTKIKEKVIGGENMQAPEGVLDRVQKVEEAVRELRARPAGSMASSDDDASNDIEALDRRLKSLEEHAPRKEKAVHRQEPHPIKQKIVEKYSDEKSSIMDEVQKILEG